jgi:hypothetical protein
LFFGEISRAPEVDLRAIFSKSNQNDSNPDSIDKKELLAKTDTIIRVSRNTRISYQWENSKNILVHVFIIMASIFKKEIISPILDYI